MVKVISFHVEGLKTWLGVNTGKVVVPSDSRCRTGIHVDPDKTEFVYMDMDREEVVG